MRRLVCLLIGIGLLCGCVTKVAAPPTIVQATVSKLADPPLVTGVAFADGTRGWLMLDGPLVLTTADGGQTWTEQPEGPRFHSMRFLSTGIGWGHAEEGFYLTVDGGETWTQQETGAWPSHNVSFADVSHGWALAQDGTFHATTGGGQSWTQETNPCGTERQVFSFVSPTTGWFLCGSGEGMGAMTKQLYRTTDGGKGWELLAEAVRGPGGTELRASGGLSTADYIGTLFFLDESHGWITGARYGTLWTTTDGGSTWTETRLGTQFNALGFTSLAHGYLIGRQVTGWTTLVTNDGGASWRQVYPTPQPVQWVTPVGGSYALGGGIGGDPKAVLRTADAGRTWAQIDSLPVDFSAMSFVDPLNGWALVPDATLYRTMDGAATWLRVAASGLSGVDWVSFTDDRVGFAGHRSQPFLVTEDGGLTWAPLPPVGEAHQFLFLDRDTWWKRAEGQLTFTRDGGYTWAPVPLHGRFKPHGIAGAPGENVWVVVGDCGDNPEAGCDPVLLATADNGLTWTQHDLGDIRVSQVHAAKGGAVWIEDYGAHIYVSDDSGKTFRQIR